jgi:hypothetical protein
MKHELRIASPCSADWDRMVGDDRVRHCAECNLDVYNFSAMASAEVERIVAERQGRLCARFYQRHDGTMLTQNCPVGFRAVVRRVSRIAGAALTAAMSAVPAMSGSILPKQNPFLLQIQAAQTGLTLEVTNAIGAIIGKTSVTVLNEQTGAKREMVSDANGRLRVVDLPAGKYEIAVSFPGFVTHRESHVAVPGSVAFKLGSDTLNTVFVGEVMVRQPNPFRRMLSQVRRIF